MLFGSLFSVCLPAAEFLSLIIAHGLPSAGADAIGNSLFLLPADAPEQKAVQKRRPWECRFRALPAASPGTCDFSWQVAGSLEDVDRD